MVVIPTGYKAGPMPPTWFLVQIEGPGSGQTFRGQFPPQEYTEDVGAVWAELAIPGRSEPILQWVRGEAENVTFRALAFAMTAADSIEDQIDALRSATQADRTLGRPPQFLFVWGGISKTVIVRTIGGMRVADLRPDGKASTAEFGISLRTIRENLTIEPVDPSKPPHLSRWQPFRPGDTFEALAIREYGNPMLGVFLRQDSDRAFPAPGTVVRLPSISYYGRRTLAPKAYTHGDSAEATAARRAINARRARSRVVPGVVTG